MLEYYLRPSYQKICVDPLAMRLAFRVNPNTVTYIACLCGVLVAPMVVIGFNALAVGLLIISGYLDTLDGSIARFASENTQAGTVLDIVFDRVVEFFVIVGLFAVDPERAWYIIFMLGSVLICITSFLVVGIFTENQTHKGFHYSPGLMERLEAFIFFIAMILFPEYFKPLACFFIILVLASAFLHVNRFMQSK